MELSVVIPTRNRAPWLEGCLATLTDQTIDKGRVEIIVVDDGSTDETSQVAARFEVRCIRQEPAGLNAGRNRGALAASGEIITFVDDDIYADPRWAGEMLRTFETTGCDAVAGRIELLFEASRPGWLSDKMLVFLSGFDLGDQPRRLGRPEIPRGANCGVTRRVFEKLGGFAPGLDRAGASLLSGGDNEFFLRLYAQGGTVAYAPGARVRHRVPADRLSKAWFRRRAWWQGITDGLLERNCSGRQGAKAMAHEVVRAGRGFGILGSNLLSGRGPLSAELWLLYCAGRFEAMRR